MISAIYNIRNLVNNKIYIGSSVNLRIHWNIHKKELLQNKHHSILLQRSYNKYGKDNFTFEILEYVKDKSKLIEREQVWIDFFKPEYNICKIAGSALGYKHTEKSKLKMSASHKGQRPWMKGKKQSKETIAKIQESRKNYRPTEETKQKMKISYDRTKRIKSIIQYDLLGNNIKEYNSVSEAALVLNTEVSNISRCLTEKNYSRVFNSKYQFFYKNESPTKIYNKKFKPKKLYKDNIYIKIIYNPKELKELYNLNRGSSSKIFIREKSTKYNIQLIPINNDI